MTRSPRTSSAARVRPLDPSRRARAMAPASSAIETGGPGETTTSRQATPRVPVRPWPGERRIGGGDAPRGGGGGAPPPPPHPAHPPPGPPKPHARARAHPPGPRPPPRGGGGGGGGPPPPKPPPVQGPGGAQ